MDLEEKLDIPAPRPKRGLLKLIAAVVVLLLLVGGGVGAYWWFTYSPVEAAEPEAESHEAPGIIALEPFVVNLAGNDGTQFLRTAVQIVVADAEHAEEAQKNAVLVARLRAGVIDLLTARTAETLMAPQGKTALRDAIKGHAAKVVHETEIVDVLLTEFVIQF